MWCDTAWHHHMSMWNLWQANLKTWFLLSHIITVMMCHLFRYFHMLASLCGPEYVRHTCVGGWAYQRRLVLICIYVLVVKLMQITIIISGCVMTDFRPSFIHTSRQTYSSDSPLNWAQAVKGKSSEWAHLVSGEMGRWENQPLKTTWKGTDLPCQNGNRPVHCSAGTPTAREGGMGLESKQN